MIEDAHQLRVTMQQMQRLLWALADLKEQVLFQDPKLNYSHLKWEFVWEPLEAVRVMSYLSNRSSKRLSSFS